MKMKFARWLALAIVIGLVPQAASADAIPIEEIKHEGDVDFEKEVLPILRKKCLACHNGTEAESDLNLETPQAILKGGSEGPAVVAGKSAESLLLKVASQASEPVMPPEGNDVGAKPLTPAELGLIKLWIDQGAKGEVLGAAAPIEWQPLPPGINPVYAVAVTPNGQFAAAGRANQVFLYHLPSRREIGRLTDPELLKLGLYKNPGVADLDLIQAIAFSPSGNLLATGGYRTLKLWRRPRDVRQFDLAGVAAAPRSAAVSSDGKSIAIGDESGAIHLFSGENGQRTATLAGHSGAVTALEFSADGTQLYSGSLDKSVRVWSIAEGKQTARWDTPAEINALRLVAKETQLATGGADNVVRLWSLAAPVAEPLAKVSVTSPVATVSPDRKLLASAAADGKITLTDLTSASAAGELAGHPGGTTYLAFNAANNRLVSIGADKKVNVWDVAEKKLLASVAPEGVAPTAAAINAAGNQLVVGADNGLVASWKVEGETATPEHAKIGDHSKRITAVMYSNDGGAIFTASEDGTVRRFTNGAQQQFAANHGAPVHTMALSADQQWIASGGDDKQIKIWNAGNGGQGPKPQLGPFAGAVKSVAFTPDNQKVLGSDAGAAQVLVFDLMQGVLEEGIVDLPAPATTLEALPQAENKIAVLAASDKGSRITPLLLARKLAGHNQPITGLAVVADDQFASASADGVIKFWNTSNGQVVRELNHGGPVTGIVVRPDGQRLVSAGANNVAKIFNLQNNQMIAELKGDLNARYRMEELQRAVALSKRHIDLAKKDLEEANKRKTSEEENAKKAAETVKTTETEFNTKNEAANKVTAEKEAADKALADAMTAKTAADEAQKKAADEQTKAAEQVTKATQERDKANQAANEAANALNAANQKLAQAKAAAQGAPDNAELAEAVKVAEKEQADAEAKNKAAGEAKAAAEKALADANAAKQAADQAKQQADQKVNETNNAVNQAKQKVQQMEQPYQKAIDERNTAMRNFEAAKRSVERSTIAVKAATDAIPGFEAALKQAEEKSKQAETQANEAAQAAAATEKPFKAIALSLDGRIVATGGDGQAVYTWDTETGAPVDSYSGHGAPVGALAFTPAGNIVSAAADKSAIVWNTQAEWKLERTIGTPDATSPIADRVTAIDFSPDETLVATGSGEPSRSGELKIWKVADGSLAMDVKEPHSDTIYDVEFSPNGQYIASCGADRFMKVFEVASGKLHRSFEGHTHHVLGVSWRSDGRMLASSGADNVIKVWNFLTGDQLRTIQGFGKEVTSLAFAGDGDAVVASSGDKTVRMKNAENGGNMRDFGGATDFLYSVAATGDGKTIVAGGADGNVLVWNDQGQPLATFAPPPPPETAPAGTSAMK